jgi:hypothetical protein
LQPCRAEPEGNRSCGEIVISARKKPEEESMPLLPIILWVGVPVVLLGGGYWIIQTMH